MFLDTAFQPVLESVKKTYKIACIKNILVWLTLIQVFTKLPYTLLHGLLINFLPFVTDICQKGKLNKKFWFILHGSSFKCRDFIWSLYIQSTN